MIAAGNNVSSVSRITICIGVLSVKPLAFDAPNTGTAGSAGAAYSEIAASRKKRMRILRVIVRWLVCSGVGKPAMNLLERRQEWYRKMARFRLTPPCRRLGPDGWRAAE